MNKRQPLTQLELNALELWHIGELLHQPKKRTHRAGRFDPDHDRCWQCGARLPDLAVRDQPETSVVFGETILELDP
jgi:hypothetical protein